MPSDLVVVANGRQVIRGGLVDYETLEIRQNGTIYFSESVSISVRKLICHEGATIAYSPSGTFSENDNLTFELLAFDASEAKELKLVGNGRNGKGVPGGAARGGNGRDATPPNFGHLAGRRSRRGKAGANGKSGGYGENAVDFRITVQNAVPDLKLSFNSVGGDGGKGQNGGDGGTGGDASITRSASSGGPAGNGGHGGNAGDCGQIQVFLVLANHTPEAEAELTSGVEVIANCSAGTPGEKGVAGTPGAPGHPRHHPRSHQGPAGNSGAQGQPGEGPQRGESNVDWVMVDVMDAATFLSALHWRSRR